jgi:hypothetical protein
MLYESRRAGHASNHPSPLQRPRAAAYALTSFHFGTPGSGKKVYIQGSLHADEVPGMLVAQFLRTELAALEAAGKITAKSSWCRPPIRSGWRRPSTAPRSGVST